MAIRQDAELRTLRLSEGKSVSYISDGERRGYWIFVLQGDVQVGGEQLSQGDSLALTDVAELDFVQQGTKVAQVMLFDLPID